jgi:predicted Zn-dependent peptidase
MKKLILPLSVLVLLGFTSLVAKGQQVERYQLPNGLTVILNEDHSVPDVFGLVVVKAGGKDDPADATGMAHYQEHMLFKGTSQLGTTNWEKERPHIDRIFALYDELGQTTDETRRQEIQEEINKESLAANEYAVPNELDNVLKQMGGKQVNANTSPDRTVYFNSFPPNQLEKWMKLYAHRFADPVFRSFQAELEVVYEEKNLYNDQFMSRLFETFQYHFFKHHPYGQQTLIGTVDDLKNPSLTKMFEFYKNYYVANNMALVLSGNFRSGQAKPLIEEYFGELLAGDLPEKKNWEEKPFNGREEVNVRMSPVKLGLLGYRTVPNGHPDKVVMDVIGSLMSNENQSGLLDELTVNGDLLYAGLMPLPYNDHGATLLFYVPKLIGQSHKKAEELVFDKLQVLKSGKFDDWRLQAAKNSLYINYQKSMEDPQFKALNLGEAFASNQSLEEVFAYPEKLRQVTHQDVLRVANAYFGENYLALQSKMGKDKPEKIEKPDYAPLVKNKQSQSGYAAALERMPVIDFEPDYVDFQESVYRARVQPGVTLLANKNEVNDIFELTLRYQVGDQTLKMLPYASSMMNYAGTETMTAQELKNAFSQLGCSYAIYSNDERMDIRVEGMEANLEKALALINDLISAPTLEESKLKVLREEEKASRKMERSEPDNVADALFSYVRYKDESSYLDRLSWKEIKKLEVQPLLDAFSEAVQYTCEVHFTGNTQPEELTVCLQEHVPFAKAPKKGIYPYSKDLQKYASNTIYFVNKKKAIQSKIYFFANQPEYDISQQPAIDAFNLYFGGGFSGLVLQEIREYRSLAYSAGAYYVTPGEMNKPSAFIGYVGTQADKTMTALETFMGLVRDMPEKEERMNMIREYLVQSSLTELPDFRNLTFDIRNWEMKGYTSDPTPIKSQEYSQMQFGDISDFYKQNIKDAPMVIAIVGDKKRIDMEALSAFGNVVEVKEKDLFH